MLEAYLRDYYAQNLSRIDTGLQLVGVEHSFPGGRYDLLAKKDGRTIGIELKVKQYNTNTVCAQLTKYLNHTDHVYFVAPKVKQGVHAGLKQYGSRIQLYEINPDLSTRKVTKKDLDDKRPWPELNIREPSSFLLGVVDLGIKQYVPNHFQALVSYFVKRVL